MFENISLRQQVIEIKVTQPGETIRIQAKTNLLHDRIIGLYIEEEGHIMLGNSTLSMTINGHNFFNDLHADIIAYNSRSHKKFNTYLPIFEYGGGSEIDIIYTDDREEAKPYSGGIETYTINLVLLTTRYDKRERIDRVRIQRVDFGEETLIQAKVDESINIISGLWLFRSTASSVFSLRIDNQLIFPELYPCYVHEIGFSHAKDKLAIRQAMHRFNLPVNKSNIVAKMSTVALKPSIYLYGKKVLAQ